MRYDIHKVYRLFQIYFRPLWMRAMALMFSLKPETTVLDVGGTMFNWSLLLFRPKLKIIRINITGPPPNLPFDIKWIVGDGCHLPFLDGEFELVYSNLVIEHLGDWKQQTQFATEVRRVGKSYYVQTPNFWFPVEPHLLTPFVHWLPKDIL